MHPKTLSVIPDPDEAEDLALFRRANLSSTTALRRRGPLSPSKIAFLTCLHLPCGSSPSTSPLLPLSASSPFYRSPLLPSVLSSTSAPSLTPSPWSSTTVSPFSASTWAPLLSPAPRKHLRLCPQPPAQISEVLELGNDRLVSPYSSPGLAPSISSPLASMGFQTSPSPFLSFFALSYAPSLPFPF